MFEYLKQYVPLYLTFNAVNSCCGQISVECVHSEATVKKYFGGALKEYIFAVVQIRQYDTGITDPPINTDEIFTVQAFMDWIDEQQRLRNYPNFGENCKVQRIENLQNMPSLAGVSEQNEAKYMFQCKVTYYEKEKKR